MLQVRRNVFETNSSSTHSLTICSKNEYQDWIDGKYYWSKYDENLIPKEEVEKQFQDFLAITRSTSDSGNIFEEWLYDRGLYTFESFLDIGCFEKYRESYTSNSGDEVVAFGYYGYDG